MSEEQSADVGRAAAFAGSVDETGAFTSRRIQIQATRSTTPMTIAVANPARWSVPVQRAGPPGRVFPTFHRS
jgi:hypothetical protein